MVFCAHTHLQHPLIHSLTSKNSVATMPGEMPVTRRLVPAPRASWRRPSVMTRTWQGMAQPVGRQAEVHCTQSGLKLAKLAIDCAWASGSEEEFHRHVVPHGMAGRPSCLGHIVQAWLLAIVLVTHTQGQAHRRLCCAVETATRGPIRDTVARQAHHVDDVPPGAPPPHVLRGAHHTTHLVK
jgi:hypothetical protein